MLMQQQQSRGKLCLLGGIKYKSSTSESISNNPPFFDNDYFIKLLGNLSPRRGDRMSWEWACERDGDDREWVMMMGTF